VTRCKVQGADAKNGKAEFRLERCNSRLKGAMVKEFLQEKARLGMEQLLFNTPVLITS
jgi:hypothetical protein